MKTKNLCIALCGALLSISFLLIPMQSAFSCTRAVYFGKEGQTITGRSMDWPENMQSNLWIFPRGISTPSQPNISSTIWCTVSDQKNRVYYFHDTASPSVMWVKLKQVDFNNSAGVRKLTLSGKPDLGGDQTANFKKAQPFKFLSP